MMMDVPKASIGTEYDDSVAIELNEGDVHFHRAHEDAYESGITLEGVLQQRRPAF